MRGPAVALAVAAAGLVALAATMPVGCAALRETFTCASDDACVDRGQRGTCEPSRRCSFADPSCADGRRYGVAAGALSRTCVAVADAGTLDGDGDGGPAPDGASGNGDAGVGCATRLAAGDAHSCALHGGLVACWGADASGQLGDGRESDVPVPIGVVYSQAPLDGVIGLALGASHSCAHRDDQTMLCWGDDQFGQLGDGMSAIHSDAPVVVGINPVVAIAVGAAHTCALINGGAINGAVWCWGHNQVGQLGDGTQTDQSAPVVVVTSPGVGFDGVLAIAGGGDHMCAIKSDGTLWCWGANGSGELGTGTHAASANPAQVASLGTRATAVTPGGAFTCALLRDHSVVCWGANDRGQLGHAAGGDEVAPATVGALGSDGIGVSAGLGHACAVKGDGTLYCWGRNDHGQVGVGDGVDHPTPLLVRGADGQPLRVAEVAAGALHTCARLVGGAVLCWGDGLSGRLGDGKTLDRATPAPALLGCP